MTVSASASRIACLCLCEGEASRRTEVAPHHGEDEAGAAGDPIVVAIKVAGTIEIGRAGLQTLLAPSGLACRPSLLDQVPATYLRPLSGELEAQNGS